jgi:hypothetical protein
MWRVLAISPLLLLALGNEHASKGNGDDIAKINSILDDWHQAAAAADEDRYFKHMAADAVFMGTDPTERWTKVAFQQYAHPYFAKGKAWSFKPKKRFITLHGGAVAWFDEMLDTPNLGLCRGSGVIVLEDKVWRIAQYNLSTPIPNELFPEVKKLLDGAGKKQP